LTALFYLKARLIIDGMNSSVENARSGELLLNN